MSVQERTVESVHEAIKASPAIAAGVSQGFFDITLPHIINVGIAVYIGLQIAFLLWKWRKAVKKDKDVGSNK